jgi:hypothetical protein
MEQTEKWCPFVKMVHGDPSYMGYSDNRKNKCLAEACAAYKNRECSFITNGFRP